MNENADFGMSSKSSEPLESARIVQSAVTCVVSCFGRF